MSSTDDLISIAEFRARHGLPDTTEYALSPDGRNAYMVWVPVTFRLTRGWLWIGPDAGGFTRIIPDRRYREGQAAFKGLCRADIPAADVINATSTPDMETTDVLHAAAETMSPIRVVTRHGNTVVFVPAPEGPAK
jgi:hypothetical protein